MRVCDAQFRSFGRHDSFAGRCSTVATFEAHRPVLQAVESDGQDLTGAAPAKRGVAMVVTLTPARSPVVKAAWIAPGTHVAAVGADKAGDQELEGSLLKNARIFVDDIRQCRTDGEINVPLAQGLINEADIAGEIGEVITGRKQGRTSDDEITIFDSTGIALQDSATVPLEFKRAMAAGVGIEKKMIST